MYDLNIGCMLMVVSTVPIILICAFVVMIMSIFSISWWIALIISIILALTFIYMVIGFLAGFK